MLNFYGTWRWTRARIILRCLGARSKIGLEDEANRIIIHITDAPPQQPDREIATIGHLVDMLSDAMIDQLHFIVPSTAMDDFEQLAETKNDGVDGKFPTVTWTSITSDVEDIVEKLRKIAKTSSGSVFDKGELIFETTKKRRPSLKTTRLKLMMM